MQIIFRLIITIGIHVLWIYAAFRLLKRKLMKTSQTSIICRFFSSSSLRSYTFYVLIRDWNQGYILFAFYLFAWLYLSSQIHRSSHIWAMVTLKWMPWCLYSFLDFMPFTASEHWIYANANVTHNDHVQSYSYVLFFFDRIIMRVIFSHVVNSQKKYVFKRHNGMLWIIFKWFDCIHSV